MKTYRNPKEYVTVMVYRRQESQPFRWLVAAIIFALSMCVTFSEVSGAEGTPASVAFETTIANQQIVPPPVAITPENQLF